MDDHDVIEERLLQWAAWIGSGGSGDGFPATNVLHPSWLPPSQGTMPSLKVSTGSDVRERRLHQAIGELRPKLKDTLVVVYVQRLPTAEQVQRLQCAESTVRARVLEAKSLLRHQLPYFG